MCIELYDTLSRTYKSLIPHQGEVFRFYCCGPTVYGPAHIGNFRAFLLQDVLRRLLEQSGQATYHLRNITDVDDKTIRQSLAENLSLKDFTEKWTERFHGDCKALNTLPPHVEPKATEHIQEQIELIQNLLDKGFAYREEDGSVYFQVKSFKSYGRLSQLDPEKLQTQAASSSGSINLADEYTRDCIHDFALWKAYKPSDGPNFWESPWGKGRPGWHIECSAMALRHLGPSFDLHAGGIDLCFPHHENEIAQSECANGQILAHHWFHNAHLLVNGSKMSKSLGNLYTLSDIQAKGFSPMALRYSLIAGHYRQPLNFTLESLHASESALLKIEKTILNLAQKAQLSLQALDTLFQNPSIQDPWEPFEAVYAALCKDLNTPAALGALFKRLPDLSSLELSPLSILKALAKVAFSLGLAWDFAQKNVKRASPIAMQDASRKELTQINVPEPILDLAQKRQAAKLAKDYSLADSYREELASHGWSIIDTPESFRLQPKA